MQRISENKGYLVLTKCYYHGVAPKYTPGFATPRRLLFDFCIFPAYEEYNTTQPKPNIYRVKLINTPRSFLSINT